MYINMGPGIEGEHVQAMWDTIQQLHTRAND